MFPAAPRPKRARKRPRRIRALGYLLHTPDIYDICVKTGRVVPPKNAHLFYGGAANVDKVASSYNAFIRGLIEACGVDEKTSILPVHDPDAGFSVLCFVLATDETEEHKKFDPETLSKAKAYFPRKDNPKWYARARE